MDSHDQHLGPLDAQALDALVDAGFDPARTPGEVRNRCEKLALLFGVLGDAPGAGAPGADLSARTMQSVVARRALTEDTLCEADGAALDALVAAGLDPGAVDAQYRGRAERLAAVGDVLSGSRAAARPSPDLAERAFGLVMLAADRPLAKLDASRPAPWARWRDLVGVAAVLLVGASVVVPVMSASRLHQLRGGCAANMASIASAMSSYASAYRDSLPVASASMGDRWSEVGGSPGRSNSANLYTLVRTGFAKVRDLACPGNDRACREALSPEAMDWRSIESVSYSYQVMFGDQRPGWRDPSKTAVLADRSPGVLRALAGEPGIPLENSPNHFRRGQSVLFCDGSVSWQCTPELNRNGTIDNIWLPWAIEEVLRQIGAGEPVTLEGKEVPGPDGDAFLAP